MSDPVEWCESFDEEKKADRGTISRVLSWALISLGCRLLDTSCSRPAGMTNRTNSWQSEDCRSFCLALLLMGFTQPARSPEPLVRSYRTVSPLPPAEPCGPADRRSTFCCTCPILADGGRYPPSCPVEPGLSSESYDSANACSSVSECIVDTRRLLAIQSQEWYSRIRRGLTLQYLPPLICLSSAKQKCLTLLMLPHRCG